MGVMVGYKQTEVGVIPEDWKVVSLSEGCTKIQDGTHFSPRSGGSEFLYITSKNIRFGFLDTSSATRIDRQQHEAIYRRCDVKKGDILLTKDGANTGNAALNILDEEISLLSSVAFLRFDPDDHDAQYFLQQILSSQGQRQIQDAMSGNAITRLTLEKINRLRIPIPTQVAEERNIGEALSDADALIESLEQLLAKKRQIKQGAMQELLTGKKRLTGFNAEWEEKCLGDVCHITTGHKDVNEGNPDGQFPFFTCSRAYTFSDSFSFDTEAILIAGNGDVGNLHYFHGKFEAYQRTYVLSGFTVNVKYLWQQLKAYLAAALGLGKIGSSIPYIKKGNLNNFVFLASSDGKEQEAIASVLSDMDEEIACVEAKLAKARELKQGMMQELLTGRIRLI